MWADSQVYLSIHSPVVPSNPFMYGKPLRTGYQYDVYVRLEEEHLLPPPYPTNCTDYDAIWRMNNKTGPRSQEMCREFCHRDYYNSFLQCETTMTMYENPKNICLHSIFIFKTAPNGSKEALNLCLKNCKENCVTTLETAPTAKKDVMSDSTLDLLQRKMISSHIRRFICCKERYLVRFDIRLTAKKDDTLSDSTSDLL
ncbi:uncharacterized protein CEXT_54431 [Caerostris extrusa]|uniref:Uncharacterized protein n=1 Tax=Caerostris extrusa TaxID=172846 RepID=A0AAV4QJK9_CAEEX|nr:uncharacterized protein CEXT_54431 [Caerostris extrusa]